VGAVSWSLKDIVGCVYSTVNHNRIPSHYSIFYTQDLVSRIYASDNVLEQYNTREQEPKTRDLVRGRCIPQNLFWFLFGYLIYFFVGTVLSKDVGGCAYSFVKCNRIHYLLFFWGTFFREGGVLYWSKTQSDASISCHSQSQWLWMVLFGYLFVWVPYLFYFLGTLLIEELVGCVYCILGGND